MPKSSKQLYRLRHNRIIAGVCGGLADYFDTDPLLFRWLFILLILADGFGIILYVILAVVVKQEPEHRAQQRNFEMTWAYNSRHSIGMLAIFFGLALLFKNIWPKYFLLPSEFFWPIMLILFGFYLAFRKKYNA